MKKVLLSALITFAALIQAAAVPITFQLDLGPRINTGEFIPESDTIEVRGSFNGWSEGFALTRSGEESTIYTGTRDITGEAGSDVAFKFVQISNGTAQWETTPDRSFALPAEATTLPVFYFNHVWEGGPIPVTFQVNMATQQAAGTFDPNAGDTVEVRGAFNDWSGGFALSPMDSNPAVYTLVSDVPQAPGARVEYKFVVVKASNGQVVWENDPNRAFMQTAEAQELPVVYFNNVTGVPVKAMIHFQVDMNAQIDAGLFDTNTQQVYIRGNKFGWGTPLEEQGLPLFEDASQPGVYTNAYRSDSQLTGDRIEYKATIWTPDTAATTWEDGANRSLVFTGTEPKDSEGYFQAMVGPYYFNNIKPGDLLDEETTVTFRVDMRNARTTGGDSFNPEVDTVSLNGSFLPGGWLPWGSTLDYQAFDDGVSGGDSTAGDGIYSVQVTLARGTASRLEYKFGVNSADNEAAVGANHVRYVRASGEYLMPVDVFGTMTQETREEEVGPLSIARAGNNQVTISWPAAPGVRLQKLSSVVGGTVTEVPLESGQTSFTTTASESMAFYRLVRP